MAKKMWKSAPSGGQMGKPAYDLTHDSNESCIAAADRAARLVHLKLKQ
jgi:hypothetical protein